MSENQEKKERSNEIRSTINGRYEILFNGKLYTFLFPSQDNLLDIHNCVSYLMKELYIACLQQKTEKERQEVEKLKVKTAGDNTGDTPTATQKPEDKKTEKEISK